MSRSWILAFVLPLAAAALAADAPATPRYFKPATLRHRMKKLGISRAQNTQTS